LEEANTPNLDSLAAISSCGLAEPVSLGITPGSGPSHLALFGYDTAQARDRQGFWRRWGRLKLGHLMLQPEEISAQWMDSGVITDRRAGRIPTEENQRLIEALRSVTVEGVEVILEPGKFHRFVAVFRGEGLSGEWMTQILSMSVRGRRMQLRGRLKQLTLQAL